MTDVWRSHLSTVSHQVRVRLHEVMVHATDVRMGSSSSLIMHVDTMLRRHGGGTVGKVTFTILVILEQKEKF